MGETISSAVIARLPRYYRYLSELLENDILRISSRELSERMKVTASQIRQDFNQFGGFGQQGYGYNVEYLRAEIGKILGLDRVNHLIILGAGNLGRALANYADFERKGFLVTAVFDVDKSIIGSRIRDNTVRPMDSLKEFVENNQVDIAAITVPKLKAPQVAADLVRLKVPAIWNFAPVDLSVSGDVVLENVHLSDSLMRLSYEHNAKRREVPCRNMP